MKKESADLERTTHSQQHDLRERTKAFALRIVRLYAVLPKTTEAQILGKQVLRAGTSAGAHYREAARSRSSAEFVSKMQVGLQELDEAMYWMELLVDASIVSRRRLAPLMDETDQLIAIFVTCVRRARSKQE